MIMTKKLLILGVIIVLLFVGVVIIRNLSVPDLSERLESIDLELSSIELFTEDGGRLDWSKSNGLIAFDRMEDDGYFALYVVSRDGDDRRCLTCDDQLFSGRHVGQPTWHPGGEWLLFQAEKRDNPARSVSARPGFGRNNDVWAIRRDGTNAHMIHETPVDSALLHPYFSNDGSMMVWAEKDSAPAPNELTIEETWILKLASVEMSEDGFRIHDVREVGPRRAFYESHGFTPDDSKIVFTSNLDGQPYWGMDIHTYDLATGDIENLTSSPDEWDEHAKVSPDGEYIAWMSSNDCTRCDPSKFARLKTDIWVMRSDGSDKQRATYFSDRRAPESMGKVVIAGDSAWSPDGSELLVRLIADRSVLDILGVRQEKGPLMMIRFND